MQNDDRITEEELESTGFCIVCDRFINDLDGRSLNNGPPMICNTCWGKLSVAERLAEIARWRLLEKQLECLDAWRQIALGAADGWHLPGGETGLAGRN